MSVSYKRLWHLLIDKDMKKKDLMEKANISDYTIRKLNRGDDVTTNVLVQIRHAPDCHIEDIMEILPGGQERVIQNMLRYSGNEDGYGRLYAISVPKGQ